MKTAPPPPSKQRTVFVSLHAIQRYQERIENVSREVANQRLRDIVIPHKGMSDGSYSVESRKFGPPVSVKVVVSGSMVDIPTVYPVTDNQITRSMKTSSWRSR